MAYKPWTDGTEWHYGDPPGTIGSGSITGGTSTWNPPKPDGNNLERTAYEAALKELIRLMGSEDAIVRLETAKFVVNNVWAPK